VIIYKIQNKINKKCYIGQTVHSTFNERYSGGRWWSITENQLLINAYNKYGIDNFHVEILAEKVKDIDELNKLEEFYADMFNAYKPNGYNLRKCGDNRRLLSHQIERIRKNRSKTYILRKIDTWELVEIFNLKEFCRKNNISHGAMYNMIKGWGNVIASNGYCLPDKTKQEIETRRMKKFKNKIFNLVDKNGNLIEVINIKQFIRENKLEKGSFYKLLNGQMLHYYGFRLLSRANECPTRTAKFIFISPQNEIIKGHDLQKFCKENNLSYNCMGKVYRGNRLQHRGWKNASKL